MIVFQALAYAVLVGFAVLGALEVDRRLAGCPDRGFVAIAAKLSARGWLERANTESAP